MCVCVCACIYIYIYIYIHTHTHKQQSLQFYTDPLSPESGWDPNLVQPIFSGRRSGRSFLSLLYSVRQYVPKYGPLEELL